jgi:hypothetical protein
MKPQHLLGSVLIGLCPVQATIAQVPDLINYQAVARDGSGNLMANQDLEIMLKIYDVPTGGTEIFAEEHGTVPTNQFGLFTLQIGTGSIITGSLGTIDWSTSTKWLEVLIDGTVIGTRSQLVTVPYAMLAKRAEIDAVDDADADPANELQTLGLNGNQLSISGGNTVTLPAGTTYTQGSGISIIGNVISNTGDLSNTNEVQTLGLIGNQLSISSGNTVTLPGSSGWSLTGNAGTNPATDFIGTTDNQPLRFRVNSTWAGEINPAAYNTSLGMNALSSNTSGDYNTALGRLTLWSNTTGHSNTAVGLALLNNTSGACNTAVGRYALLSNITGTHNSAFGYEALYQTTGTSNAAFGSFALGYNVAGVNNTAIGVNSGTNGSYNNTVSVGNWGYLNAGHNQAFLGNTSMVWNGGNVGWSTFSDARVKTMITEDVHGLDFIALLRPVTYYRDIDLMSEITGNEPTPDFEHKYDIEQIKFSGFLAQEVEAAANAVGYDFSGLTVPRNDKELYTLSYEQFVVPLVKAVQELNEKVKQLEAQLAEQQQTQPVITR